MNRQLSFNAYRDKWLMPFYNRTVGKKFNYKGQEVSKFEVFATLFDRYKSGNSLSEVELVLSGMSRDFTLVRS